MVIEFINDGVNNYVKKKSVKYCGMKEYSTSYEVNYKDESTIRLVPNNNEKVSIVSSNDEIIITISKDIS